MTGAGGCQLAPKVMIKHTHILGLRVLDTSGSHAGSGYDFGEVMIGSEEVSRVEANKGDFDVP